MAATNPYCTTAQVKAELLITNTTFDTQVDVCIGAASRQIDGYTGRFFYQDASVQNREFYAENPRCIYPDDISTTSGLVVKVDVNGDGTFAQTLAITTDFIVLPVNAADRQPAWPFEEVRLVTSASAYFYNYWGRPGVQVTAKFGWPAIPDDITKACIVQAVQLFKAKDAPFGVASFGDSGGMRIQASLNPLARALVEPYCKSRVG